MDKATFGEQVKRLKEVNTIVSKFDPAIREGAFGVLKSYITARPEKGGSEGGDEKTDASDTASSAKEFLQTHEGKTPSDNALGIAAYWYSQYGAAPLSYKEVRRIADKVVGVTVPKRLEMTLGNCKRKKKFVFSKTGKGAVKPTVHGQTFLEKKYGVTKGMKAPPPEDDK